VESALKQYKESRLELWVSPETVDLQAGSLRNEVLGPG
jgi:hypothetical protein